VRRSPNAVYYLQIAVREKKRQIFFELKKPRKIVDKIDPRSQSYQTLISPFFSFLLLSLSVCGTRKYCLCFEMAKLNNKKQKKSLFYKEKSLVGLTPGLLPLPRLLPRCHHLLRQQRPWLSSHPSEARPSVEVVPLVVPDQFLFRHG
jgi:hypothetical protein